jgi:hypothetical protein
MTDLETSSTRGRNDVRVDQHTARFCANALGSISWSIHSECVKEGVIEREVVWKRVWKRVWKKVKR